MITCTYDELCDKILDIQYDSLAKGVSIKEVTIRFVDGELVIDTVEEDTE